MQLKDNLKCTEFIFDKEAYPKEIKKINIDDSTVLFLILLRQDYTATPQNYTISIKFEAGYYVLLKQDDKFLSNNLFTSIADASVAFNAIYTMLKTK